MIPAMWSSFLYEWKPKDMVRTFAEHGWRALELSGEHAHALLSEGDPLQAGKRFRAYAGDHGVSFPQGHFDMGVPVFRPSDGARMFCDIAPPDDGDLEKAMTDCRRWLDFYAGLGVKAGVLHLGGERLRAAGWPEARIFERRVQALARLADHARGGPTVICLENLLPESPDALTAEDLLRVIQAVGAPHVGLCLDTGHALVCKVDSAAFVRSAGPLLKALHIADNLGTGDHHMLPYGRGKVDWPPILQALRETGYAGLFNFEVPGENHGPPAIRLAKLDYALVLARHMIDSVGLPQAPGGRP